MQINATHIPLIQFYNNPKINSTGCSNFLPNNYSDKEDCEKEYMKHNAKGPFCVSFPKLTRKNVIKRIKNCKSPFRKAERPMALIWSTKIC